MALAFGCLDSSRADAKRAIAFGCWDSLRTNGFCGLGFVTTLPRLIRKSF